MRMPASITPRDVGMIRCIVGSLRPETHTAGQPTSRGQRPVLRPGPLCWRPPQRWRVPEQNGAGMARRLRGPLWGRMSPQAAAGHLWARKGPGAIGYAREREASALTGDIARFWSKVNEALNRLETERKT